MCSTEDVWIFNKQNHLKIIFPLWKTFGKSSTRRGGDTSWKMRYRYVQPWRPPFHALLAICKTPISAFFNSQNHTFTPKSQISRNFQLQSLKIRRKKNSSKASNQAKIQFVRPYFVKKLSSLGSQIRQWSIHKPSVRPSGLPTYTKMKDECPWLPQGVHGFQIE